MTWDHRVYRQTLADGEIWFTIREAFYEGDSENPHSWTEDAIAPGGNTLRELRTELERMLRACDRPVLEDTEHAVARN